jgi:hypothetical protein
MNGMIQIVGYMVAAYGVARLIQASITSESAKQFVAVGGCIVLALLAALLTSQANSVASLAGGF